MKNKFPSSRRQFIHTSFLAAAGLALFNSGCSNETASTSKTEKDSTDSTKNTANETATAMKIGLQLYSIPSLLKKDFKGTLKMISDIGYKEVEFAGPYPFSATPRGSTVTPGADSGYYGNSAAEVKQILNDYGLSAPSAHIPLMDFQQKLNEAIDAAHTVGHEYLICPFLEGKDRNSIDSYKKLAEQFNRFGETCKKGGIQFAYHNHCFEFGKLDGQIPYDVLLENTDKDLVKMELDLFWVSISGVDPLEYFKKYPNRFPLCHCKNMETNKTLKDPLHTLDNGKLATEAFENQSDLSKGVIDFKRIFAQADQAGIKHYIVERDRTPDVGTPEREEVVVKDGYTYMKQLFS